jgi:hypothetical protein
MPLRLGYSAGVDALGFESLILYVSDLRESRAFYVVGGGLGLPVVFEDDVIVVGGHHGRASSLPAAV